MNKFIVTCPNCGYKAPWKPLKVTVRVWCAVCAEWDKWRPVFRYEFNVKGLIDA